MAAKIRVGIVFGGRSGEHEISLISAQSVMDALDRTKYQVVPLGITKEGKWLPSGDPMRRLKTLAKQGAALPEPHSETTQGQVAPSHELVPGIGGAGIPHVDVIFPVLHGPYGEDGTIQGLLEMADMPYVGAGVLGSALCMDKAAMKSVFRADGLPVVDHLLIMRWDWEQNRAQVARRVEERFDYPCFVKPANLGSSVAISKVHGAAELAPALDLAARYDRRMLVERAVNAREIECSVLGNDHPIASVLGEIVPKREFYDYEAKYFDETTELVIPADLPAETAAELQDLAVRAYIALDCAGMARADLFIDRDSGEIYVNELNTIPGFTSVSMYPKLWEASGMSYPELVDRLIELAIERFEDKARTQKSYEADQE